MAEAATQEIRVNPTSRGFAVIITNDYAGAKHSELKGTHKDGERMKEAFEALKFDVCWKKNVNQNDIQQLWQEITSFNFKSVKHYNCMAFVFSGHGEPEGRDGKLIMQDDTKIDICDDFIAPVLPGNAKMIGDIPKIFFIDACRGDEATETVDVPTRQGATGKGSPSNTDSATSRKGCYQIDLQKVPTEGSCLVAYSTLPGRRSNDYAGKGSLWLEILARHLTTNHETIETLLTDVNKELLAYYRKHEHLEFQQPEKMVRLNDRLYLLEDSRENHGSRQLTPPEPMELDQPLNTPTSVPTQQPPTVSEDGTSVDPMIPQPEAALVQDTPIQPSSSGVLSRPKGSGKYCAHLKQYTRPQFAYVTD